MRTNEGRTKHGFDDVVLQAPRTGNNDKNAKPNKNIHVLEDDLHHVEEMLAQDDLHASYQLENSRIEQESALPQQVAVNAEADFAAIMNKIAKDIFPQWFAGHWIIDQFDMRLCWLERTEQSRLRFMLVGHVRIL